MIHITVTFKISLFRVESSSWSSGKATQSQKTHGSLSKILNAPYSYTSSDKTWRRLCFRPTNRLIHPPWTLQWDWWGWLVLASGTGRGESCRALTVKWYSHWIGHSVRGNTRQCAECPQGKSRHDSFLSISLFFSDSSAAECFPECDGLLTVNMKTYEYEILFLAFFWRIQKCFDKEEECLNFFSQDISHSPSGNETLGTL